MNANPPLHAERQHVTTLWIWALVLALAAAAWIVFAGHLLFGLEVGDAPPPWLEVILLVVFGIGFPSLLAAFRLDITVDDEALTFVVRPFLRRRIPHHDIARAEAVRYRPIRDYLGWGVKWMPGRGWAYTVAGDRGVRVHLTSGRAFLLGSREPDELAAALTDRTPASGRRPGARGRPSGVGRT